MSGIYVVKHTRLFAYPYVEFSSQASQETLSYAEGIVEKIILYF